MAVVNASRAGFLALNLAAQGTAGHWAEARETNDVAISDWSVRGRALNGFSEPLADLQLVVSLKPATTESLLVPEYQMVWTDTRGVFCADFSPPHEPVLVDIQPTDKNFWVRSPALTSVFPGRIPKPCQLLVEEAKVVTSGRVVDEQGLGIANATVRLKHPPRGVEVAFKTDFDGYYNFRTTSVQDVVVTAPGFGNGEARLNRRVIVLPPEMAIQGWVKDSVGKPLSGAIVVAKEPNYRSQAITTTDAAGSFYLDQLDPESGFKSLTVSHSGYRSRTKTFHEDRGEYSGQIVALEPGEDRPMAKPRRVRGVLVGEKGQPLAGVEISTRDPRARPLSVSSLLAQRTDSGLAVRTDECGYFEFNELGARVDLYSLAPGYAPLFETVHLPPGQGMANVVLQLESARRFRGRVIDRAGGPIAWASVSGTAKCGTKAVFGYRGFPPSSQYYPPQWFSKEVTQVIPRVFTDERGEFELDHVPQGKLIELRVMAEGFELSERTVSVTQNEILLPLSPAGLLQGRVVDAETGEPVAPFEIRLRAADCDSLAMLSPFAELTEVTLSFASPDGRWEIDHSILGPKYVTDQLMGQAWLQEGITFDLEARASGYAPTLIECIDGGAPKRAKPLVIGLKRGARIWGRVMQEDGESIPGTYVHLTRAVRSPGWNERPGVFQLADSDGYYQFENVADGSFELSMAPPHGLASKSVVLVDSSTDQELNLHVPSACDLRGVALDHLGQPIPGRDIVLGYLAGPVGLKARTVTNTEGGFIFRNVPDGSHQLSLMDGEQQNFVAQLDVNATSRKQIRFQALGDSSIEGEILAYGPRDPEHGVRFVRLIGQGRGLTQTVRVNGDHFKFHGVEPGNWYVECQAKGFKARAEVRVKTAREYGVHLQMGLGAIR